MVCVPLVAGMFFSAWPHSFLHFWFLAALFPAFVAFVLCGVSFYRGEVLVGLYSMIGSATAFVYVYLMFRSQPIY